MDQPCLCNWNYRGNHSCTLAGFAGYWPPCGWNIHWEAASSYQPILLIQNTSGKIVVLESIEIKYYGKNAYMIDATEDFKFAKQSIIEAGHIQKIPINTGKLKFAKPSNPKRKYALKVIIRQRTGPKKVCAVKYSYEELGTRFFGQGLFSGS